MQIEAIRNETFWCIPRWKEIAEWHFAFEISFSLFRCTDHFDPNVFSPEVTGKSYKK